MTAVVLSNVTLAGDQRPRLDRVSLNLRSEMGTVQNPAVSALQTGLRTAVVGYSGAGKTSLLHVIAGFTPPASGSIDFVRSSQASELRLPLYWVPQSGGLWDHLRVEQHLLNANSNHQTTNDLLERLDLSHRRNAFPAELSQGERSRVSLARALSANAELLVMDEPLSHVDVVRKPGYWMVIDEYLRASRTSLIFSSHEPEIVLRWSTDVVCLHDGRVLCHGPTRALYDAPPNEQVGKFLGPLNWFSQKECLLLLDLSAASLHGQPVRPEHMELTCHEVTRHADSSGIELVSTAFCGSFWQSEVRHCETNLRKVICHRSKVAIPPGSLVKLHLIRHDASTADGQTERQQPTPQDAEREDKKRSEGQS